MHLTWTSYTEEYAKELGLTLEHPSNTYLNNSLP